MNKWQIICPVVAMLLFALVAGMIGMRGQHRGFISVASSSIGSDLIDCTNSSHLVRIGPDLKDELADLLAERTHIADVILGDEPPPIGDGTACSRILLTNDLGKALLIRLRAAAEPSMFEVAGFRAGSE